MLLHFSLSRGENDLLTRPGNENYIRPAPLFTLSGDMLKGLSISEGINKYVSCPPRVTVCVFTLCLCTFQFSVFLGLIFFLELTAGILAFVFKDWIKDQLNFFINNNVKAYRDDIDLQNLIDFAQEYVSQQLLALTRTGRDALVKCFQTVNKMSNSPKYGSSYWRIKQ